MCLETRCWETIESSLNDTQCSFHPGRSTTDHISHSTKFLRNLGSMLKTSSHALSISWKHTTGFLVKSFGERCVSTVLTTACYWLSSHRIPAQKFHDRGGRVKSRQLAVSVGLRQGCALSQLLFIVYISDSQPFCWREPNPDLQFCWRASLKF